MAQRTTSPKQSQKKSPILSIHPLTIVYTFFRGAPAIAGMTLAGALLTALLVSRIPSVYEADLLILIDSQKIPERFVTTTVNAGIADRMATIMESTLTPDRTWALIHEFNLYKREREEMAKPDVIALMRQNLVLEPHKGFSQESQGAFRLSFKNTDPTAAAAVVNRVGALLIDGTLSARESLAEGTSSFMREELERARVRLEEQEAKLSAYKLSHNGALPQQESVLLRSVDQSRMEMQRIQDEISRQFSNRASLESMLSFTKSMSASAKPQEDLPGAEPAETRVASRDLELQLQELLKHYKEAHPKVQALRATLNKVRAMENPPLPAIPGAKPMANVTGMQSVAVLEAQIAAIDKSVSQLRSQHKQLAGETGSVQGRLSTLPIREQELAAITRDYDISRNNYMQVLDKIFAADMASNMERRQKAERFTISSPAEVPTRPIGPKRGLYVTLGAFLVFMAAAATVFVRQFRANRLLGEWELPEDVSVFGRIPHISGMHESRRRRFVANLKGMLQTGLTSIVTHAVRLCVSAIGGAR